MLNIDLPRLLFGKKSIYLPLFNEDFGFLIISQYYFVCHISNFHIIIVIKYFSLIDLFKDVHRTGKGGSCALHL